MQVLTSLLKFLAYVAFKLNLETSAFLHKTPPTMSVQHEGN